MTTTSAASFDEKKRKRESNMPSQPSEKTRVSATPIAGTMEADPATIRHHPEMAGFYHDAQKHSEAKTISTYKDCLETVKKSETKMDAMRKESENFTAFHPEFNARVEARNKIVELGRDLKIRISELNAELGCLSSAGAFMGRVNARKKFIIFAASDTLQFLEDTADAADAKYYKMLAN